METAKKYKWALTGFIIMIILNIAVLLTVWMNIPDGRDWRDTHDPGHERPAPHKFMQKELGLTNTQVDSMATLRKTHFQEMRRLRRHLERDRKAYFDFLMSPDADNKQKKDSLVTQLTQRYLDLEQSLYRHMSEMKSILNSEQQQKFKRLMKDSFLGDPRSEGERRQRRNR